LRDTARCLPQGRFPQILRAAKPARNKIETGVIAWAFQAVHHDVWDLRHAGAQAQPTLARIDTGQGLRDVVIQPTKQGLPFVLDRDTGQPVWPVEERAVPQGGAGGEVPSPAQPFPTHVPNLMSQRFTPDDVLNFPPIIGNPSCKARLAPLRNDELYTPPSTQGTLQT
jgi:quinoprotein glucose dehydrogenase